MRFYAHDVHEERHAADNAPAVEPRPLDAVQAVLTGAKRWTVIAADAIGFLNGLPARSVDLCFFSPPYTGARLYLEQGRDLGIARDAETWTRWMMDVFTAARRVCKGAVCCVCEGQTQNFRWDAAPALLMADLHRAGFHLRRPCIFHRVGIPGSGGPDYFRADSEYIIVTTRGGKLPWSDPTACGHPPKYAPGGPPSHRTKDGKRVNAKHGPSGYAAGDLGPLKVYKPPKLANPGNVIHCQVGGGRIGNPLAHQNEAPFPEALAERFIKSFCPPNGVVCDPFAGSGTTLAVAVRHGRRAIGCDLRASQVELSTRRILMEKPSVKRPLRMAMTGLEWAEKIDRETAAKPPTPKQKQLLKRHGLWRKGITFTEASTAIDQLIQSWNR